MVPRLFRVPLVTNCPFAAVRLTLLHHESGTERSDPYTITRPHVVAGCQFERVRPYEQGDCRYGQEIFAFEL